MFNWLKVRPKYDHKPVGIEKFMKMYEDVDKMEKFLEVPPNTLKFSHNV